MQEVGGADFGFAYGNEARFRVSIFRVKGHISLVLRRIPNGLLTFDQIRAAGHDRRALPAAAPTCSW